MGFPLHAASSDPLSQPVSVYPRAVPGESQGLNIHPHSSAQIRYAPMLPCHSSARDPSDDMPSPVPGHASDTVLPHPRNHSREVLQALPGIDSSLPEDASWSDSVFLPQGNR